MTSSVWDEKAGLLGETLIALPENERDDIHAGTGRRTMPQVNIGDLHVGGFDDMARWDREGRLAPLLAANSAD